MGDGRDYKKESSVVQSIGKELIKAALQEAEHHYYSLSGMGCFDEKAPDETFTLEFKSSIEGVEAALKIIEEL